MPSKGIDFYGFVADGYEIEVRKANAGNKDKPDCVQHITSQSVLRFYSDHYEINTYSKTILGIEVPIPVYTEGRFQFIAKKNGQQLFERSIRVDGLSGNIDSVDINNIRIPSRVEDDYCLSFGLYDSDNTNPNAHQVYATLTSNRRSWMKQLFSKMESQNKKLSSTLLNQILLPGSHDAGMYTNIPLVEVSNLANTQRDTVDKQLELGARYFDYRPGKVRNELIQLMNGAKKNKSVVLSWIGTILPTPLMVLIDLYADSKIDDIMPYFKSNEGKTCHIHAVIPGESYFEFIKRTVNFLEQKGNEKEMVVINIADSGIVREADIPNVSGGEIIVNGQDVRGKKVKLIDVPTKQDLENEIASIIKNTTIKIGNKDSLKKDCASLINNNERLIILNESLDIADSYSSNYESYDKNVIIEGVEDILRNDNTDKDLVKLQLQLTPTGSKNGYDGIIRAVKGTNKCTSPLYATKPRTDKESYRLLLSRTREIKKQGGLVVAQNDFYDNALTEVCLAINELNLGLRNDLGWQ